MGAQEVLNLIAGGETGITAIWFWDNEIEADSFRASDYLRGTLPEQYKQAKDFALRTLHKIQSGEGFNSLGVLEVPEIVLTELLTNALVHRDYFVKDTIKLYIFKNRIEIISPGKLPNNLTVEQMKKGIRKKRNDILDSLSPVCSTTKVQVVASCAHCAPTHTLISSTIPKPNKSG